MDEQLKLLLSQIIDNQMILNKKMETVNEQLARLTNTIIKYDEEYQQKIVEEAKLRR